MEYEHVFVSLTPTWVIANQLNNSLLHLVYKEKVDIAPQCDVYVNTSIYRSITMQGQYNNYDAILHNIPHE